LVKSTKICRLRKKFETQKNETLNPIKAQSGSDFFSIRHWGLEISGPKTLLVFQVLIVGTVYQAEFKNREN